MAERTFSVFAFTPEADGSQDERRDGIPEWKVDQAAAWALGRGHKAVFIQQTDGPASSTRLATHHLCADSRCPGGCQ